MSIAAPISHDHPALNTPQTIDLAANAYAPPTLQHGLTRDDLGHLQVKPEIVAKLDPKIAARAARLLAADRTSEANSIAGCCNIHNVTSSCGNHEAEYAPVVCGKPLLHEACATPKARVAKFGYEHPELRDHLLRSTIQVLTFTTTAASGRAGLRQGREQFARFQARFDGDHGWQWAAGFSRDFDGTTFYAIHEGDRLPYWPELNARWRRIAGNAATLRVRTFDGRDGDSQRDGLLLANSGFLNYWDAVDGRELDIADEFRGEDLTALYGTFRGFASHSGEPQPAPEMPICGTCGKRHVPGHGTLLLTLDEMGSRFGHIRPMTYGQRRSRVRVGGSNTVTLSPSPPV